MHAVLSGGLRLPATNFVAGGGSRKYVLDREIADGHVWFNFHRPNCLISMSSVGSERGRGGRPGRNSPPSDRSRNLPNTLNKKSVVESSKVTQQEMIALFKRIQTAIMEPTDASKTRRAKILTNNEPDSIAEQTDASKKRRPNILRKKLPADSVSKAPHTFPTKNRVREQDSSQVSRSWNPLEENQETQTNKHSVMSRPVSNFVKRSPMEENQETQTNEHSVMSRPVSNFVKRSPMEENQETQINKHSVMSRPVSNFVKRSPIPPGTSHLSVSSFIKTSPIPPVTSANEENESVNAKNSSTVVPKQSELQGIDELKITELKELAKSKGVKGYSRLKKGELVELLKGLAQP